MLKYNLNNKNLQHRVEDLVLSYYYWRDDDSSKEKIYVNNISDIPFHYQYHFLWEGSWHITENYDEIPSELKARKHNCINTIKGNRYKYVCDSFTFAWEYKGEDGKIYTSYSKEEIPVKYQEKATINKSLVVVKCAKPHHIKSGMSVTLSRNNKMLGINETKTVNVTLIDNYRFYFENLTDITLNPSEASTFYLSSHPNTSEITMVMYFPEENRFFLSDTDGDVNINNEIDHNYFSGYNSAQKKEKSGDYVVYEQNFLYIAEIDENGRYILPFDEEKQCGLYQNHTIKVRINSNVTELNINVNEEFIIPYTNGRYDTKRLLWKAVIESGEEKFIDYMMDNFHAMIFTMKDERFFKVSENDEFIPWEDFRITVDRGDFNLSLGFSLNGGNDILSEYLKNDYIEQVKNSTINPPIDYEKQVFYPVFISNDKYPEEPLNDDDLKPIEKIQFNLHFRKRKDIDFINEQEEPETRYWVLDSKDFWNSYTLPDGGDTLIDTRTTAEQTFNDSDADLIGYLGFDDDDVYYRKNRLKKSFLRLSFYDSPYRATQQLLYYSTVFFDTGKLYSKYVLCENIYNTGKIKKEVDFVNNEMNTSVYNKEHRLSARFECYPKEDMINSSEGFYLYLFPNEIKGNTVIPIYMKVEFNNAKYGTTVPFMMPTNDMHEPIKSCSPEFPFNYGKVEVDNGGGEKYFSVDMQRAVTDTYIKLFLKYDFAENRYVYFLPRYIEMEGDENVLKFDLFEPRLNYATQREEDILNGK